MESVAAIKLTPLRATLLRLVAYSKISRHYGGDAVPYYSQEGEGLLTGTQNLNALAWLVENDFVRCVGERGGLGFREGLLRPTSLGEAWLDAHRRDR